MAPIVSIGMQGILPKFRKNAFKIVKDLGPELQTAKIFEDLKCEINSLFIFCKWNFHDFYYVFSFTPYIFMPSYLPDFSMASL